MRVLVYVLLAAPHAGEPLLADVFLPPVAFPHHQPESDPGRGSAVRVSGQMMTTQLGKGLPEHWTLGHRALPKKPGSSSCLFSTSQKDSGGAPVGQLTWHLP